MRLRTPRALLAVAALGAVLTQQACSPPAPPADPVALAPSPSPSPESSPTATPAESPDPVDPSAGAGSGEAVAAAEAAKKVPDCRDDDVSVRVTDQSDPAQGAVRRALVTVTNTSASPCRIAGRAAISLVDAADEVVDVPVRNVTQPGAATPILLRAGTSAFEGIKWTTCDKADPACPAGNTLRFTLPGSPDRPVAELSGFPAAQRSDITMGSLQIGTLQPSSQGVVAW